MVVSMDNLTDLDLKALNAVQETFERIPTNWFHFNRVSLNKGTYVGLEGESFKDVIKSLERLHECGLIIVKRGAAGRGDSELIKITKIA